MLVHEPRIEDLAELEEALTASFVAVRAALGDGQPVVIVVDDRDLRGGGEVAPAALAGGLLGLARALAIEGRREGWRVAVLAADPELPAAERELWLRALGDSDEASGTVLRLGADQLGRVPV